VGLVAHADPVQAEPVEAEPQQLPGRLRGVPVAGVVGVQHISDLALPVLGTGPDQ
jgi:hypothetical protein